MIRKTLGDAKDPEQCGIAQIANVSPDDPRFTTIVNLATQNLVQTGEYFWGLHARYQFCITNGCIVWPREIANIETIAVSDRPIPIRNRWFEWLETGIGLRGDGSCVSGRCGAAGLFDRASTSTCTFAELVGNPKYIKIYTDVPEDADAKILLQGYDENGQWIRTFVGGEWIDGEYVSLATSPMMSTHLFSSLTNVQKPVTNGVVRLYGAEVTINQDIITVNTTNVLFNGDYIKADATHYLKGDSQFIALVAGEWHIEDDDSDVDWAKSPTLVGADWEWVDGAGVLPTTEYKHIETQTALAIYEPDETRPSYRKQLLTDLGCGCAGNNGTSQVTVMAKLEFIPVRNDNDWLMIGNFSALESEVQSIMKRRNNLFEESVAWHMQAIKTLRDELRHYLGAGAVVPMRMQSRNLGGAAVRNLV